MSLTIDNPVLFFAVLVAVALWVPMLFERARIPGLVGIILVAVLLGPHALGVLERNVLIDFVGQAGLLFIVFLAGLEIDLHRFAKYRNHSLVFGLISFLIPQVLGTLMAVTVLDFNWLSAILLGSMFGSHTLLTYPIASRLGIVRSTAVTTAVGGTIITDVSAMLVLAVIANMAVGDAGPGFWVRFASLLAIFLWLVLRILPMLARWFYRNIPDEGTRDFLFTILMVFICSWLAEYAGLQPIIGAFLCGIALNRLIPERSPLMSRIQFVGKTLLVPVFLISVGMLIDPMAVIADQRTLLVVAMMSVTVISTKAFAAVISARILGYSNADGGVLFGMSVNQAAATLAAVLVGYHIGLFDTAVLNGAVIMILVSCLIGPWATQHFGRRTAERLERQPRDTSEAPQRILVPLANPTMVEPLIDLSLLLHEPTSRQPIFPLVVVTDDPSADDRVAAAEKLLEQASQRGTAVSVPIYPITRVDVNIADGIRRTIMEQQITTVVIGWTVRASFSRRIFGNILDQLLAQSRQSVVVARIRDSLSTVNRVLLAVPRSAENEPSFFESIHLVKTLCQQLSTPLEILGPVSETPAFRNITSRVPPEINTRYHQIDRLRDLPDTLTPMLRKDDLLILLSTRSHNLSWTPSLETLPRELGIRFPDHPLLIIYAAEDPENILETTGVRQEM